MSEKQFHIRTRVVLALLGTVMAVFGWVLFDLQVVNGQYYLEQSTRKIANTETVQAARGEILDRYGRVLVTNRTSYQVTLNTALMGDVQGRNSTLLDLLSICREQGVSWNDSLPVSATPPFRYTVDHPFETTYTKENGTQGTTPSQLSRLVSALKLKDLPAHPTAAELVTALRDWFEVDSNVDQSEGRALVGVLYELALRSKDVSRSSYIFAQDVDVAFITLVKEHGLAGVRCDIVTLRQYNTSSAAHLLGQVGAIPSGAWEQYQQKGYSMNDTVGRDGVELAFEDKLRGTPGVKDVEYNQSGKIVAQSWQTDPKTGKLLVPSPGQNVTLTIDLKLQQAVEQALERHIPGMTEASDKGACVVLDMSAGVLASASYPSYDPATYRQLYNQLYADPLQPLFNRALLGLYAPGSTFKMAVAAGALEEGKVTPREKILDTGRYRHYDRIQDQPQCWYYRQYGGTHGYVNVSEAIRDSCNVYFYEAGLRLGIDKLDEYAALFGLGKTTGLELYEAAGEVAGPASSQAHGQTWYEGETMYAAIGQGNTQVTPIQLANYVVTLINGGDHYATHLLKTTTSNDASQVVEEYQAQPLDTISLSQDSVTAIKQGMRMVANSSSFAPYFSSLPVTAGAKTGSAQVASSDLANAILVTFAPYDDPQIAMCIVVERGGSGSAVASIAAEILDAYFSPANDPLKMPAGENILIR